jgi:PilZ domain-containing protein
MRSGSSNAPERRPASAVPTITGLRFMPQDTEARLVNISRHGILAESMGRVPVGAPLEVIFEGGFTPRSAAGRVARCEVAVMGTDALLRYHIAIEFDEPISFDGDDSAQPQPHSEPEPVLERSAEPIRQKPRNRW